MTKKGNYLGELEELVLLSIASQSDQAYGVSIKKDIMKETDRNVNISAIHEVLKRLERKGYLQSKMGGATKERGGRRKRYFILTAAGRNTLEETMNIKLRLYKRIPNFTIKPI